MAVAKLLCFVKGHLLPLNRRGEGTCGPYYCGGQLTVPWGSGTHGKESSRPLCRGDSDLQRPTSLPAAAEVSQLWLFFFSFLFQDTERAQRPNKHTSLCILCSATSDCASSQSHAAGSQLQGQPRGHYARSRMTPLSEPSRRWHFVGSTARLVSVPRKFSELSLVVLLGRAEDSSME